MVFCVMRLVDPQSPCLSRLCSAGSDPSWPLGNHANPAMQSLMILVCDQVINLLNVSRGLIKRAVSVCSHFSHPVPLPYHNSPPSRFPSAMVECNYKNAFGTVVGFCTADETNRRGNKTTTTTSSWQMNRGQAWVNPAPGRNRKGGWLLGVCSFARLSYRRDWNKKSTEQDIRMIHTQASGAEESAIRKHSEARTTSGWYSTAMVIHGIRCLSAVIHFCWCVFLKFMSITPGGHRLFSIFASASNATSINPTGQFSWQANWTTRGIQFVPTIVQHSKYFNHNVRYLHHRQ